MIELAIKVVVKQVDEQPKVKVINNTLEALREIVGGCIEMVPVLFPANRLYMVRNDTGKLDGLLFNFFEPLRNDIIVGNVFFTACNSEGDLIDLSDEQIRAIKSYLETQTLWQ